MSKKDEEGEKVGCFQFGGSADNEVIGPHSAISTLRKHLNQFNQFNQFSQFSHLNSFHSLQPDLILHFNFWL